MVVTGEEVCRRRASAPTSPVFLVSTAFLVLTATGGAVVAWRQRHRLRG